MLRKAFDLLLASTVCAALVLIPSIGAAQQNCTKRCVKTQNTCVKQASGCAQTGQQCAQEKLECAQHKNVCVSTDKRGVCIRTERQCARYERKCAQYREVCLKQKTGCAEYKNICVEEKQECKPTQTTGRTATGGTATLKPSSKVTVAQPSCTGWMRQTNGVDWRTCVDDKGRQYCQESSRGSVSRVSCR